MKHEITDFIEKTNEVTIKTMDYNKNIFSESLNYFNDITNKMFYTYTVQVENAVNKATEYAKENITKFNFSEVLKTSK